MSEIRKEFEETREKFESLTFEEKIVRLMDLCGFIATEVAKIAFVGEQPEEEAVSDLFESLQGTLASSWRAYVIASAIKSCREKGLYPAKEKE